MTRPNTLPAIYSWLAVLLVACSVLLPRLFELDRFVTVDEPEWLFQSGNFYYALGQRDYAQTYRREHPGVVTMWAGVAAYQWLYPEYRGLGQGYLPTSEMQDYFFSIGQDPLHLLKTARIMMVLVTTIILSLAFVYARRLFGLGAALCGSLLLAFDPFHTALTRLLHLDGMESNFVLLSLLALLAYLYLGRKWYDLVVTASAGGLATITKSPGVFIFFFIALWSMLLYLQQRLNKKQPNFWLQVLRPGLAFGLLAYLTITLVWPAMWNDPFGTLQGMFGGAFRYAVIGHGANYFNGHIFRPGIISWRDAPLYYLVCWLWRSTPLTLFGLLLAFITALKRLPPFDDHQRRQAALALLVFPFIFLLFMTLGGKKLDRYMMPIIPPLLLLAGLGWHAAAGWLKGKMGVSRQEWAARIVLALVIIAQLGNALPHFPYYLSYYNPLLGGAKKAPQVMLIGWGEGLDLAAAYLNQKEGAQDMLVLSTISYGSTSFFFAGESQQMFRFDEKINPRKQAILDQVDYALVYVNSWQRTPPEMDYFINSQPEKVITLNGLEYVRIYPRSELSFVDQSK